jgi:hypothetical protein
MAQEPEMIRRQIEETRERVGEDVDALGHKMSPKEQIKDKAANVKDAVADKAGTVVSAITGGAGSAAQGVGSAASSVAGGVSSAAGSVKDGAVRTASIAKDNPLGLAIGAAAAGFLVGLVIPITRKEDEKLGPVADSVKEKAAETGREAIDRGKQVVQEVAEQAVDAAKVAGQEQMQELRSSTEERMEDIPKAG